MKIHVITLSGASHKVDLVSLGRWHQARIDFTLEKRKAEMNCGGKRKLKALNLWWQRAKLLFLMVL
jgi:hypothetical protein